MGFVGRSHFVSKKEPASFEAGPSAMVIGGNPQ
jgi:hypothetical protein